MKKSINVIRAISLLIFMLVNIPSWGQINIYGTSTDQIFSKVIRDVNGYYALGQEGSNATISRIDNSGVCQWTRVLTSQSAFTDGILTPYGLLVVGFTLPFTNNRSILAQINSSGGFIDLKSYDGTGTEAINRLVQLTSTTFFAVGYHTNTGHDVVLFDITVTPTNCIINRKQQFPDGGQDGYNQDILQPAAGSYMICGSNGSNDAIIWHYDYNGSQLGGVLGPDDYIYSDIELTNGNPYNILAAANSYGTDPPYIARFDEFFLPVWERLIFGLKTISQIITDANGIIYVVGNSSALNRNVVIKLDDLNGSSTPSIVWADEARYLNDFTTGQPGNGFLATRPGGLVYADGRVYGNGFGQNDYFLAITNPDLSEICTDHDDIRLTDLSTTLSSPFNFGMIMDYDLPMAMTESAGDLPCNKMSVCSTPCKADFTFVLGNTCGYVEFTNNSTGTPNLTYCWDFNNDGICESTQMDINWTFPSSCQTFPVTLTITCGDGSTDSYTLNVTINDVQAPGIVCPPDLTMSCTDDTSPVSTGLAIATDKCTLVPVITHADNIIGNLPCVVIERTWTATDDCTNSSFCTQYISVVDNIPPVISNCPTDVTVNLQGTSPPCQSQVTLGVPTVTDLCDLTPTLMNSKNGGPDASGIYPNGTTIVIWTATDDCGNTATCSVSVTVNCIPFCGFKCGQAIVAFHSTAHSSQTGHVLEVVDLRPNNGNVLKNWNAKKCYHPDWTAAKMGEIFGIAIDKNNDVFVTASKAHVKSNANNTIIGPGGEGGIYKIDHITGAVSTFVQTVNNPGASCASLKTFNFIPNNAIDGPGLGNIAYDETHNQFFVTNFEDGKIYLIDAAGIIQDCFDPFLPAGITGGVEPYDEMIWGIGVLTDINNTKVYFGRWRNDYSFNGSPKVNEVHSLTLTPSGGFPANWQFEFMLPPNNNWHVGINSNPISDIEFSLDGTKMLITERTSTTILVPFFTTPYAHMARVLEYNIPPPFGTWPIPKTYLVGKNSAWINQSAAGGVDYGYQGIDPNTGNVYGCDYMVWVTGDELNHSTFNTIGGLAGIPVSALNTVAQLNNYYVDLDGDLTEGAHDQRLIGDIDIFKCGCPTLAAPGPCETVIATVASSGPPGDCRWSLSLDVQEENIRYVEIEVVTPGVIINTFDLSSSEFKLTLGDSNQGARGKIQIKNPTGGGFIAEGSYADIAEFSLGNIDQSAQQPQKIVVNCFVDGTEGSILLCSDTIIVDCPPPSVDEACWSVAITSNSCNPAQQLYTIGLDISNLTDSSSFTHIGIWDNNVEDPFILTSPIIQSLPEELFPGSTIGPIEIELRSDQFIVNSELAPLDIILYSDSGYCRSSIPFSTVVEACCSPCEGTSVSFDPEFSDPDACDFTLDLDNGCAANYFTRIETEITTPGVVFSEVEVSSSSTAPWYFASSNSREVHWSPVGDFIPFGNLDNLMRFELADILNASQSPQTIEIRWIAKDENGQEFVACSENITLPCQSVKLDSCIVLVDHIVECLPDGNQIIHLTIENNTDHLISDFSIYEIEPVEVTITESTFINVDLEPGERWTGSIPLIGGDENPLKLYFQFTQSSIPEFVNSDYTIWTCYDDLSFSLPKCITALIEVEKEAAKIYPNPTTGNLTVELQNPLMPNVTVRILSIAGTQLMEKKVEFGKAIQTIETAQIAEGMYFIQIVSGNRVISINKFVKM